MGRAVALQSSKTAILLGPRFESRSGLRYCSLVHEHEHERKVQFDKLLHQVLLHARGVGYSESSVKLELCEKWQGGDIYIIG